MSSHPCPRSIQVFRNGRQHPALEVEYQFLVFLRFFNFRQPIKIGVSHQLGRQRTLGAQEQESGFLQSFLALGFKHAIPPVGAHKITA